MNGQRSSNSPAYNSCEVLECIAAKYFHSEALCLYSSALLRSVLKPQWTASAGMTLYTLCLAALTVALISGSIGPAAGQHVYSGAGPQAYDFNNSSNSSSSVAAASVLVLGGLFPVHANEDNACGRVLDLGVQRLEAMVFAVGQINSDPSLLPGVRLEFEIRDTCTQANRALEESLDYVSARKPSNSGNGTVVNGISGVVGAASSSVSIAVANLLRLFEIPQISYASTAKVLSDTTRFDYFFRTVPPDSLQAKAMADIIVHFNWTYIVAIYSSDAYGSEGIRALIQELEDRNGNDTKPCIATLIEVNAVADESDFERVVDEMSKQWVNNASVAVIFGGLSTAIGVLEAVNERQATDSSFAQKKLTWIGSDAWGDQIPSHLYRTAHGMLAVAPQFNLSDTFDDYFTNLNPQNNAANPWFVEYWETIFNCTLSANDTDLRPCDSANHSISADIGYTQNSKVTFTIDAVYAFAHAIDKMHRELCGDSGGICDRMLDQRNGLLKLNGELLLQYIYNVSFAGTSENVIDFDDSGDEQGGFLVRNLQTHRNRFTFENVATWHINKERTSLEISGEIQWNQDSLPESVCSHSCEGGFFQEAVPDQADCCWVCRPCLGDKLVSMGDFCVECEQGFIPNANKTDCVELEPSFLRWSAALSIVIIIISVVGIFASSFVAAVFIVYHKTPLIKASSRELSAVLITGIILCYLLPIFFVGRPSPAICAIQRFGVGFCFSICYSALLVKTNRIFRIFRQSKNMTSLNPPPLISPQSQLFFTFLLVSVQVLIAVIWLIVERPATLFIYYDFSTELKCAASPHIGISVSLGYNLLLLLLSTYFAFRSRKVPQNFNEAKFINLTLYAICIVWLAFIPTYFATAGLGTIFQTSSQVLAIDFSATTTLCFLFMPKIYFLFSKMRKEQSTNNSHSSSHHSMCTLHAPRRRQSYGKC